MNRTYRKPGIGPWLRNRHIVAQAKHAAKHIVVGVDSSHKQVEIARQRIPDIDIVCDDGLEYLKRYPNTFSRVFYIDMLEYLEMEDLCLEWVEKAFSGLKIDGFFCCRSPNAVSLTANYSRYMHLKHQGLFTSNSLLQLLEASVFQNCRIIPIREAHLKDRFRLSVERPLHRIIFRICGHKRGSALSSNVCAVGFKKVMSAS